MFFSPQGSAAGKKYKFVVTGHGKYEKIPVDDENGEEFSNGKCGKMKMSSVRVVTFNQTFRGIMNNL